MTPVVRAVETKTVQKIAAELRDLTKRARKGQLKPGDYTGGTCTISNLGMFGVSSLFAILNPPQSCILGFGYHRTEACWCANRELWSNR
ncbi:MAG: hypothetical protein CM1200mP25_1630 [Acidobacteriota bacterium]|nr:MAG: hypothetical protein CM1200mP25_1630 [Acidobacteriota bacterium]